ncbi:hypothetical protein PDESU_03515 [Pontiella desulfatans]|uniref:SLA1 homology domain-containing protein n=1 Tax=Pontiella desulfatans TaxID=2750659 RepID=A0A6C2U4W2_PONDE|nr:SHD1 domain-containing protein [Pontiella desulfatans]VGO14935.1 hypothetical protein PDESU_03515 [Pontiella desulfatans]
MLKVSLLLLVLLLSLSSFAEFRIWEDGEGNIWEAEFVTLSAGEIVMRDQQGQRIMIRPEKLSGADQQYLEKVVPPKLVLDVSKTTNNAGTSSNTEQVRCIASIKQSDTRPYAGELTAVLVTMGEDIRTGAPSVVNRKEYNFTLPEKRGDSVDFKGESASFLRKSVKSGRTYSGYVLVVWDKFGNPIAIKSNRDSFAERAEKIARPKQTANK